MLVFAIGTKFKHPEYDCYISITKHLGGDSCEVEWSGKEKSKHRNSKKMTTSSLAKSFLLVTPAEGVTNIIDPFRTVVPVVPAPTPVAKVPAEKPVEKKQLPLKLEPRIAPPEQPKVVIRSNVEKPPLGFMEDVDIHKAIKRMISSFPKDGDFCNFLFKIEYDYFRELDKDRRLGFGDHLAQCGFDDDAIDLYRDFRDAKIGRKIVLADQLSKEFNKLYRP